MGDNKISSAEESRVASKTPPSVTEQINKKTEQVPDDASKNTVQDTPTDTPTGTAALTEATKDSPVLDKRNSPTEDKELLLPKADNKVMANSVAAVHVLRGILCIRVHN